jgi:hypothetical protein
MCMHIDMPPPPLFYVTPAIADPNTSNKQCLDTLLATVFVNTGAPRRLLLTCLPPPQPCTQPSPCSSPCLPACVRVVAQWTPPAWPSSFLWCTAACATARVSAARLPAPHPAAAAAAGAPPNRPRQDRVLNQPRLHTLPWHPRRRRPEEARRTHRGQPVHPGQRLPRHGPLRPPAAAGAQGGRLCVGGFGGYGGRKAMPQYQVEGGGPWEPGRRGRQALWERCEAGSDPALPRRGQCLGSKAVRALPSCLSRRAACRPPPPAQGALVDPLPEVRATAAKAMGSLVKGEWWRLGGGVGEWGGEQWIASSDGSCWGGGGAGAGAHLLAGLPWGWPGGQAAAAGTLWGATLLQPL